MDQHAYFTGEYLGSLSLFQKPRETLAVSLGENYIHLNYLFKMDSYFLLQRHDCVNLYALYAECDIWCPVDLIFHLLAECSSLHGKLVWIGELQFESIIVVHFC